MRKAMMRTQLLATTLAIAVSVVAGCASMHRTGAAGSTARALPGTPACFFRRNFIGSWQVLNNSSLILYTLPADRGAYLVELFQPVVGLKFNLRLGLFNVQRTSQICGNGTSYLLVPGNTPGRVLITQVRKLTPPERDQLLAEAGHPPSHRSASSSGAAPE